MKLHEAQPSAILPSSLQRVEFIPKLHSCLCYHKLIVASFVKVKVSDFQTCFHNELVSIMSSGFLLLPASQYGSGLTFFVHRAEAESLPS